MPRFGVGEAQRIVLNGFHEGVFFIIPCCAVQAVLGYDGPPPLTEVDGRSPIRMGGEMLGGYRSYYVHRGEKMGGGIPWRARFPAEPPCRIPGR